MSNHCNIFDFYEKARGSIIGVRIQETSRRKKMEIRNSLCSGTVENSVSTPWEYQHEGFWGNDRLNV
jgi:hypothetical protein